MVLSEISGTIINLIRLKAFILIRYFFRKVFYAFVILFGVLTLVFFLFTVLPGDPAQMMLDQNENSEQIKSIRKKFGFDLPIIDQYVYYTVLNGRTNILKVMLYKIWIFF